MLQPSTMQEFLDFNTMSIEEQVTHVKKTLAAQAPQPTELEPFLTKHIDLEKFETISLQEQRKFVSSDVIMLIREHLERIMEVLVPDTASLTRDAIEKYKTDMDEFQLLGQLFHIIKIFSRVEDNITYVTTTNIITQITLAMENFSDDLYIQKSACSALVNILPDEKNSAKFIELQGIPLILRGLRKFVDDEELTGSSCAALANVAHASSAFIPVLAENNVLDNVLAAMIAHPTNPIILGKGLAVIRNFVCEDCRYATISNDAVKILLLAMIDHKVAKIHRLGCATISNIATQDELCNNVVRQGGISVVQNTILKFMEHKNILMHALSALKNIAVKYPLQVATQQVASCVMQAMGAFPCNELLQYYGCSLVAEIGNSHSLTVNVIGEDGNPETVPVPDVFVAAGAIEHLLVATEKNAADDWVYRQAMLAISRLCINKTHRTRFLHRGGINTFVLTLSEKHRAIVVRRAFRFFEIFVRNVDVSWFMDCAIIGKLYDLRLSLRKTEGTLYADLISKIRTKALAVNVTSLKESSNGIAKLLKFADAAFDLVKKKGALYKLLIERKLLLPVLQALQIPSHFSNAASVVHRLYKLFPDPCVSSDISVFYTQEYVHEHDEENRLIYKNTDGNEDDLDENENDLTIMCDNHSFYARKDILVNRSSFFKMMLSGKLKESSESIIVIQDVHPDILFKILQFLYSGTVDMKDDQETIQLLVISDKFLLDGLKWYAERELEKMINEETIVDIFILSLEFNGKYLRQVCAHWIIHNLFVYPIAKKLITEDKRVYDAAWDMLHLHCRLYLQDLTPNQ